MTKIYRCTRNAPYKTQLVPVQERQGYYLEAPTSKDALARMSLTFPDDTDGFTAELWIALNATETQSQKEFTHVTQN